MGQALVKAGDFVSILVARDETLHRVSAPMAQANTVEQRQAFVQEGKVRLCTAAGTRTSFFPSPVQFCCSLLLSFTFVFLVLFVLLVVVLVLVLVLILVFVLLLLRVAMVV